MIVSTGVVARGALDALATSLSSRNLPILGRTLLLSRVRARRCLELSGGLWAGRAFPVHDTATLNVVAVLLFISFSISADGASVTCVAISSAIVRI